MRRQPDLWALLLVAVVFVACGGTVFKHVDSRSRFSYDLDNLARKRKRLATVP